MTVQVGQFKEEYTGNGTATEFSYGWRVFRREQLLVTQVDTDGNRTELSIDTDYTVTGVNRFFGGDVVLNSPLPTGYKLFITPNMPIEQQTDLRNQGRFYPETLEDQFDRQVLMHKMTFEQLARTLKRKIGDSSYDAEMRKIKNLAEPTEGKDATTKEYVDAEIAKVILEALELVGIETIVENHLGSDLDGSNVLTFDTIVYEPGENELMVFVNGDLTTAYTENGTGSIQFNQSLDADDEIVVYYGADLASTLELIAERVLYNNAATGISATNIQQVADLLVSFMLDRQRQTNDFKVHDAMFSWWAKPMVLRYTDGNYNRTYQTFTQADGGAGVIIHDHINGATERYILDTDRTPDDHNAGCVQVGDGKVVVVIGGRSNTTAPVDNCLVCEWDIDDSPNGNSFNKYYLDIGRDYPNLYQYDNDAFLLVSQRGANGLLTGHSFRLNSWPLSETGWGPLTQLTDNQNSAEWMYITSRRNATNPNIIDLAIGFHPEFQSLGNIYKAQIRHVGGAEPWRLYVAGSEIANMHTGVGLPVTENDFEVAYTASANEKTRLYDVKDDAVVFTSYFNSDTANSVYKYAYKDSGSWSAVTVGDCGAPFLDSSAYFGGAAISENGGFITASVNVSGYTRVVEFGSSGGGSTWFELENYTFAEKTGANIIHGRTMAEVPSLSTLEAGDTIQYQMMTWAGHYSPDSFTEFNTTIVSLAPRPTKWTPATWEQNGAALASRGTDMFGDYQASIASEGGSIDERERQVIAGSSGGSIRTRNTAMLGSRNMTFTGFDSVPGITDNWIMGSLGSNESTVAKDYSALIGCNQSSIDIPDALTVRYNVGAASDNCTVNSSSSFVFFAASRDAIIDGDFGVVIGSDNCDIGSGTSNFGLAGVYSSINSSANNSRSVVIGSTGATSSQAGSAVIASDTATSSHSHAVAIASNGVASAKSNTLFGGTGASASSANRGWELDSATGDLTLAGTVTENHTFADIAKMIENGEGKAIPHGTLLTLIGNKVYKAKQGQRIDAIEAATPAIVQNDTPFSWQGRFELDEWGKLVYEDKDFVQLPGYNGPVKECPYDEHPESAEYYERIEPADDGGYYNTVVECVKWNEYDGRADRFEYLPSWAETYTGKVKKENPDYDPNIDNAPRRKRPDEWVCAGVHGVIRTRIDDTVTQELVDAAAADGENLYIEPGVTPGIGTLSATETNCQVMAVEKPFNGEYAVGLIFLR
jgi:hypothetical protein